MREPDPDASEQLRRGGRHYHAEEHPGAASAHILRSPDQHLVDREHGVARRYEDREEAREGDDADLGRVAQAEQQQEDRQERDLGYGVEKRHQRIEEMAHARNKTRSEPNGDASSGAQ